MASRHLIARRDLAALRHRDAHHHIHTGGEVGIVFAREDLDVHNFSAFAMRHPQRSILHITRFFAEDGTQQALFRRKFFFAFWRYLPDQDIVRSHFGADADDPVLIQVLDRLFTDIRNVAGDLFGAQLGITRFHFVFLNMD